MNARNLADTQLTRLLHPDAAPALRVFLPAGSPNWTAGIDLLHSFARHGAGVLEVGVPHHFSDSSADGVGGDLR